MTSGAHHDVSFTEKVSFTENISERLNQTIASQILNRTGAFLSRKISDWSIPIMTGLGAIGAVGTCIGAIYASPIIVALSIASIAMAIGLGIYRIYTLKPAKTLNDLLLNGQRQSNLLRTENDRLRSTVANLTQTADALQKAQHRSATITEKLADTTHNLEASRLKSQNTQEQLNTALEKECKTYQETLTQQSAAVERTNQIYTKLNEFITNWEPLPQPIKDIYGQITGPSKKTQLSTIVQRSKKTHDSLQRLEQLTPILKNAMQDHSNATRRNRQLMSALKSECQNYAKSMEELKTISHNMFDQVEELKKAYKPISDEKSAEIQT